jgi:hypothetical protein
MTAAFIECLFDPAQSLHLSSPGTRVRLRRPEHKLDDPGDPEITDAWDYWMPAFAGMTPNLVEGTGVQLSPE